RPDTSAIALLVSEGWMTQRSVTFWGAPSVDAPPAANIPTRATVAICRNDAALNDGRRRAVSRPQVFRPVFERRDDRLPPRLTAGPSTRGSRSPRRRG